MPIEVRRLLDRPIVRQAMSQSLGNNINGPSLIRVPEWVEDPLGRYYLYFAHHEGRSIRLAYADHLTGPWIIHEPGALHLEASLFPHDHAQIEPKTGEAGDLFTMGVDEFNPHIASPDVHVDETTRKISMYYHGMIEDGDQKTRLAISEDGLRFNPQPDLLEHYYFRVFQHGGWFYAVAWGGYLYRAAKPQGPFERGPPLFEGEPLCPSETILRHLALMCHGDQLHLFFSRIGDTPESIQYSKTKLHPDWHRWQVGSPHQLLGPEDEWEGGSRPVTKSIPGATYEAEHALRDPCIFRDREDGRTYLLYCGAGEQAIGIVELTGL